MRRRLVVGCMTGTSLDALDAALVAVSGTGLGLRAACVRTINRPLGPWADVLRSLAAQEPHTAATIARLTRDFARLHVQVVRELAGDDVVDLVTVHGQTVFHAPQASWQLLNPTVIAHGLQVPVVCDLRAADLAAGGQGAPITPIADYILFRDQRETRGIINLGGFCNVALLPSGCGRTRTDHATATALIRGGDVCACNQLLDGLARRLLGEPYDADGRRALTGQVRQEIRDEIATRLKAQVSAGRSLGTGDELEAWSGRFPRRAAAEDILRSACEAVATVIVDALEQLAARHALAQPGRYLLAGGGVKNRALREAIAQRAPVAVDLTDAFGVAAGAREAVAMAVLGALCQDGVAITLPAVTGVPPPAPLAGVWVRPTHRAPAAGGSVPTRQE